MKKIVIGYIFDQMKLTKDEKLFIKFAEKNNSELVLINIEKKITTENIESLAKKCDIFYNNSAEEFAMEIVKSLESLRKKVIDSSEAFYKLEDKWLFYLKCHENKIPVPKTILLSENLNLALKELKDFSSWPVVLKRIEGSCGDYVAKAENVSEAKKVIQKFWKKGSERLPIIAQEMIKSDSYRVTWIGDKIVQNIVKKRSDWKATGVGAMRFGRFKIDNNLKKIISNLQKIIDIKVCGVDFLRKEKEWLVLEVNQTPGLRFIESQREMIVDEIIKLLKKEVRIKNSKH